MKAGLYHIIESVRSELIAMSDKIYDNPETGLKEYQASKLLTYWLEAHGFSVERGLAGIDTAFRAVYRHGDGGPNIGLLCEYDALDGMGHACAHHLQGPSILGAAYALKSCASNSSYTITVYGTPAEETVSGKIMLIQRGVTFEELDVALMMHGSGETQTDVKSMAATKFIVTYHGKSAHAAICPENGRSALDALMLAFHGVEILREHVKDDVRMHYTIIDCGGTPANIVPAKATASFYIRSYSRTYLDSVTDRFRKVLQGAAMMTETSVDINVDKAVDNKIPSLILNDVINENAKLSGAPRIRPAREKTGSTDFGNILHRIPGSCIRVAFVPEGSVAHSQEFLDGGKTEDAHNAVIFGAKILAGTALDLIENPELLRDIQAEHRDRLNKELKED